jgi:Raf kinase inhibitor-like YbhB/YbcL family protein
MALKLISRAFPHEDTIPDKYSKDGGNISPDLEWMGVPDGTKSLALIVDDPDAPSGVFVHWLVYGIPPGILELKEDLPGTETLPNGARQGRNGFGEIGYGGPQPPSGVHRYFFRLYALDQDPPLRAGASREELDQAIKGHTIEKAELMGRYRRGAPGSRAA